MLTSLRINISPPRSSRHIYIHEQRLFQTQTAQLTKGEQHKTLWPLQEEHRPRNVYFKKKMRNLRKSFDQQILKLKGLISEIDDRRAEIHGLREELFVGTSIQESRKSVENSEITVQQGHNIKILTMVSIFFLPLTFVTSVFGMTNSMGPFPSQFPVVILRSSSC